ncbi:hypothetical protein CKA32_000656 [Geitlerinema sp. FC II]|nr:hypothetical protein CKA32_000656 [Geitlerinema sp. FC II]
MGFSTETKRYWLDESPVFQSLEGIFGFFNFREFAILLSLHSQFQSLEGIFGFFNLLLVNLEGGKPIVSIPRKDFWVFQPGQRPVARRY